MAGREKMEKPLAFYPRVPYNGKETAKETTKGRVFSCYLQFFYSLLLMFS